ALVMLLFSVAYGILATRMPLTFLAQQEMFNSRTMPYALALLGIVLSLLIVLTPTADPEGKPTIRETVHGLEWKRAIWLVIAMILYGLVLKWLGFILASILFLMFGFYILDERGVVKMLLVAVPLVLVLWFLMSKLLGVYIAPGEIFYLMGIL
ncbi:tripartite tricarboxylate transporter TctB family protein, partial [bacterium]